MGKKTLVLIRSSVRRSTPSRKPVRNFAFQAPKHFGGKLHGPSDLYTERPKSHASCRLVQVWSCRDVQFETSTCWIVKLSTWRVDRVVELSVLTQNNQGWNGTQEGRLPGYCSFSDYPILQVTHHPPYPLWLVQVQRMDKATYEKGAGLWGKTMVIVIIVEKTTA